MTAVAPEASPTAVAAPAAPATDLTEADLVLADVLVEEISIDGMCGVY